MDITTKLKKLSKNSRRRINFNLNELRGHPGELGGNDSVEKDNIGGLIKEGGGRITDWGKYGHGVFNENLWAAKNY